MTTTHTPVDALDRCIFLMSRAAPHPADRDLWADTLREASIIADRYGEDGAAGKSFWPTAAWILAAVIAALLVLGWFVTPALAHHWYPRSCCSDKDCFATGPANVTATPEGWRVESSGEVIPYDDARIRPAPPQGGGDFHVCHIAGNPQLRILCLFVPQFGA